MQVRYYAGVERALRRLGLLLRNLGKHGGSISPSVYETAQVLRFCPQLTEPFLLVSWLLRRQHVDGGWGDFDAPLYRTVPTLAAVLALHKYHDRAEARRACDKGLQFLASQHEVIDADTDQYLPVAIELILPRLLDDAEQEGIFLPRARFRHIDELRIQRIALIAVHPPPPNSPPMFSWEAWGKDPDPELVGEVGGVGHSPAATAWWLHLNEQKQTSTPADTAARERALAYLDAAAHAVGSGIPGVVPSPWPMNRFEQSFVLHTVVMAGLATCSGLMQPFAFQAKDLRNALTSAGIGFSDAFVPDGDDTSAAVAVVAAAGLPVNTVVLAPFQRPDHFVAYPFELQISHAVTARAVQVLGALGGDVTPWHSCIVRGQQPDGWWQSEKWNRSRLYGTHLALAGLEGDYSSVKQAAAGAFLRYQHEDGGWGSTSRSTPIETAFATLTLCRIVAESGDEESCLDAIYAAHRYLRRNSNVLRLCSQHVWISKDLFCARRIDQATILCALLAPYLSSRPVLANSDYNPRSIMAVQ